MGLEKMKFVSTFIFVVNISRFELGMFLAGNQKKRWNEDRYSFQKIVVCDSRSGSTIANRDCATSKDHGHSKKDRITLRRRNSWGNDPGGEFKTSRSPVLSVALFVTLNCRIICWAIYPIFFGEVYRSTPLKLLIPLTHDQLEQNWGLWMC